jgi:hypothetical protein
MADPARVAAVITDVVGELTRWQHAAQMAVDEASYIQTQGAEQVTQADRLASLAVHEHGERVSQLARTARSARQAVEASAAASESVAYREAAVANAAGFAEAMLRAWNGELHLASDWLARAKERVRRAEAWVSRARTQVAAAQRAVSHAENALRSCNRDPDRRNCHREVASLRAANAALVEAVHELQRAEEELRLAKEEEARAQRRVNCCTHAVRTAESAVHLAAQATHEVEEGRHMAALAHDHANNAMDCCGRGDMAEERQKVAAEAARRDAVAATDSLQSAVADLRRSERSYESARRLSFDGTAEMTQRITALREFDHMVGF